ncbi:MAG: NAD(P)H-flavin reductase [Gammaproteobacteria bacterium]|nr:NAD(P)H-flavin reductase [Gammaproteobacteria bacterium]MCH9716108.1 NAD(P)H-flavin reductase [Gammaproteobacteria bacterium]
MPIAITPAQVTQVTPLTNRLLHVTLTPEQYIHYDAGQYLEIVSPNPDETLYYSIANAPLGSQTYELHISHQPNHIEQQNVLDAITKQGRVILNLPFGHCTLHALNPNKPILFIAGGTGFAPIKAMIEQLLTEGNTQPFTLFWSARTAEDLYLDDKVLAWEKHVPHFTYTPHITYQNQTLLIEKITEQYQAKLNHYQVILAGPFDFVHTLRDGLIKHGVPREQLFSDAFN